MIKIFTLFRAQLYERSYIEDLKLITPTKLKPLKIFFTTYTICIGLLYLITDGIQAYQALESLEMCEFYFQNPYIAPIPNAIYIGIYISVAATSVIYLIYLYLDMNMM